MTIIVLTRSSLTKTAKDFWKPQRIPLTLFKMQSLKQKFNTLKNSWVLRTTVTNLSEPVGLFTPEQSQPKVKLRLFVRAMYLSASNCKLHKSKKKRNFLSHFSRQETQGIKKILCPTAFWSTKIRFVCRHSFVEVKLKLMGRHGV